MSDQISNRSKKMKTGITGEQIKANARKLSATVQIPAL